MVDRQASAEIVPAEVWSELPRHIRRARDPTLVQIGTPASPHKAQYRLNEQIPKNRRNRHSLAPGNEDACPHW